MSDAILERILECATEFEVGKDHVLVQPNQPGAGLFIIVNGTVAVELRDRTLERRQGEFVGELALLDERGLRSARVRTLTPARCSQQTVSMRRALPCVLRRVILDTLAATDP